MYRMSPEKQCIPFFFGSVDFGLVYLISCFGRPSSILALIEGRLFIKYRDRDRDRDMDR